MKFCCDKFEWMVLTARIEIDPIMNDDDTYNIRGFSNELIKGDCTHCMFCGKRFEYEI